MRIDPASPDTLLLQVNNNKVISFVCDALGASEDIHFLLVNDCSVSKPALNLNFDIHLFELSEVEIEEPEVIQDTIVILACIENKIIFVKTAASLRTRLGT